MLQRQLFNMYQRRKRRLETKLPPGFLECEYLESTGKQYIDTGIVLNSDCELRLAFTVTVPLTPSGFKALFGARSTGNLRGFGGHIHGANGNTIYYNMDSAVGFGVNKWSVGERCELLLNSTTAHLDGKLDRTFTPTPFVCDHTALLFGMSQNGVIAVQFLGYIHAYSVSESGTPIQNLIPALDPTGRPCMYDTVTQAPLYNQGTGEFLYKLKD